MYLILQVIWEQLKPFYEKVHAYIRYKFQEHFGEANIHLHDPMPAHIFGNMWAQEWSNVLKIVTPFPDVTNPLEQNLHCPQYFRTFQ